MPPGRGRPPATNLLQPSDALDQRTILERERVSSGYNVRLSEALAAFIQWCARFGKPLHLAWADSELMAGLLAHYDQFCRDSGLAIWKARYGIVALQRYHRPLKGCLKREWDALQSWQLQIPLRSRLPIPRIVTERMAIILAT